MDGVDSSSSELSESAAVQELVAENSHRDLGTLDHCDSCNDLDQLYCSWSYRASTNSSNLSQMRAVCK